MIETNEKYSWDSEKRELNMADPRGLDMVELADAVFDDPGVVVERDDRKDYGEPRYRAFALVNGMRVCLCFTPREGLIHIITIFQMHEKPWRKYYGDKR